MCYSKHTNGMFDKVNDEMRIDMARNKYPEETYQLILDVSMRLFFEPDMSLIISCNFSTKMLNPLETAPTSS